MRFFLAFIILCLGRDAGAVGWAVFLMLWKIGDMIDDLPKKG